MNIIYVTGLKKRKHIKDGEKKERNKRVREGHARECIAKNETYQTILHSSSNSHSLYLPHFSFLPLLP